MRFVHQSHNNVVLISIFRAQLPPQACELLIGWAPLTYDLPVIAPIVMDVDDTKSPGSYTCLYQVIVQPSVFWVEGPPNLVPDQELPCHGKSEHIHTMLLGKMTHLSGPVGIEQVPTYIHLSSIGG